MREIRFRAWSTKDKLWCGAFSIHKTGLFSEMINAHIQMPQLMAIADAHWQDLSKTNPDGIVVQQFTGFTDQDEKEIYEGDIVRAETGETFQVQYSQGMYVIRNTPTHSTSLEDAFHDTELKAIGNIYENPELLGDTKKTR